MTSPAWLALPASIGLARPPTRSQLQLLPLEDLEWENFERLCYRLAKLRGDVEGWATLYGSRGQKQDGIDIYVRRQGTGKYSCWQAKRKKLTASGLRAAIAEFEKGVWWAKSDQFCLCTSSSVQDTKLQDEIEGQRTRLETAGIDLQVQGQTELSAELKDKALLVRDFFGRVWATDFCPTTDDEQIARLDANEVGRLRRELRTLYASNFSTLDPGIIVSAVDEASAEELPLLRRFIEPDVELVTTSSRAASVVARPAESQDDRNSSDLPRPDVSASAIQVGDDIARLGVSTWVGGGENAVLVADGGLGKSTCLRAFALDQLDDGARFPAIATRWPDAIPILLPFAFWVRVVEDDESHASLASAVDQWLRMFDASEALLDLVGRSLAENRGLLLIDGLDEWSNEAAAKSALTLLNTFVRSHSAPAIATGRPAGLARLGSLDPIWRRGQLASLSEAQQRELAMVWLGHFDSGRSSGDTQAGADRTATVQNRVSTFFGELALAGSLVNLAGTPLLLSGLISLHLRQVTLPRSRFQAYEELIGLLLETHPSKRAQAALDRSSRYKVMVDASMRREALAFFAFEKRKRGLDAGAPVAVATTIVRAYLESLDGPGLSRTDAITGAKELVDVGAEATGLIVERAPQEVGFVHAIFEETLAGLHLGTLPINVQLEFVQAHAGDPRWTTSILAMVHSLGRPTDVDAIVKAIHEVELEPAQTPVQQILIAEALFGDFKCSARLVRELSPAFYQAVSHDGWQPYRRRLLRNMVEAAGFSRPSAEVRTRFESWFPDPENYRHSIYRALRTWPEEEALDALFLGLFNPLEFNKNSAAEEIVGRFRGDPNVGERLLKLCHTVAEAETLSAAMEAWMDGWGDPDTLGPLVEVAAASADRALRLTGVRGRIKLGVHDDEDLEFVLHQASGQSAGLGAPARLFQTFVAGWPNNERVLNVCWDAFIEYGPKREINRDLAAAYLLRAAVTGSDIDQRLGELIEQDQYFFSSMGSHAKYIKANYGPRTHLAIDDRLAKTSKHFHNDIAHLAVMSGSETAKMRLIELLDDDAQWAFWPVFGLLDGWGLADASVAPALAKVAAWPPDRLQFVAHHVPQLIPDKTEARNRLLEIARLPKVARPDFLVSGLQRLGIGADDTEVVDALLRSVTLGPGIFASIGPLILGFGADARVREMARQQMQSVDGPWAELIQAYGNDPNMRAELSPFLRSLGTNFRAEIVSTMEGRAVGDNAFIQSLARYSLESDASVRCAASIAYHEAIQDEPEARTRALEKLGREIRAIGPQMEAIRQAAFAGLVALDALHIQRAMPEAERKWPIGHHAFVLDGNRKLFAYIARRWERIGQDGSSPLSVFGAEDGEHWMIWDRLAPYIRGSEACRMAFLDYCAGESKPISGAALEALAREMPGSELLKAQCFRHVAGVPTDVNSSALENRRRQFIAGRLIGQHFGADPEMPKRIAAISDDFLSTKIAALSAAWPTDPLLKRELVQLIAGGPNMFVWSDAAYLASAAADDDAFVKMLLRLINHTHGGVWDFLQLTVEPIVRRLVTSPGALERLRAHLNDRPTCADVASLPRLIAQADGLDADTRTWCEKVVRRETSGERMPSFGMDVTAGAVRPVAYAVLDALVTM